MTSPVRRALSLLAAFLVAACAPGSSGPGARPQITDRGIGGTGIDASVIDLGGGLRVQAPQLAERGIGGTGISPGGIGGTGIIGTITAFGSVFVDGVEAVYAAGQAVTIDGRPATTDDLRLGQIVRLEADGGGARVQARDIAIVHEVIGPVTAISGGADGMTAAILGQTVRLLPGVTPPAVGDWVAVSGLRRPDEVLVASRLDPAPVGEALLRGSLASAPDGGVAIGGLRLLGAAPTLAIGRRATVSGVVAPGGLIVQSAALEPVVPFDGRLPTVLIEAYARDASGTLGRDVFNLAIGAGGGVELRAVVKTPPPTGQPARPAVTQPQDNRPPAAETPQAAPAQPAPRPAPAKAAENDSAAPAGVAQSAGAAASANASSSSAPASAPGPAPAPSRPAPPGPSGGGGQGGGGAPRR